MSYAKLGYVHRPFTNVDGGDTALVDPVRVLRREPAIGAGRQGGKPLPHRGCV